MNDDVKTQMEAAAFRGLIEHLQRRKDVQNIDLMNLAGFCRNCLSKWYLNAGEKLGVEIDYAEAQEVVFGMPYSDWKKDYQGKATAEQLELFEETIPLHAYVSGHQKAKK